MFTPAEIMRLIVEPTGLELVQPLDTHISLESFDNLTRWGDGDELQPRSRRPWPHILLKGHGAPWTSAFLAFRKPA